MHLSVIGTWYWRNGIYGGIHEENKYLACSPIVPHRKLAQNRRCSTRRAAPSRHAMSGARYSNHLHAEEAAGSLEALIRDYESRGRRLRVRTTTSAPNVLPIHHPACLRPARLVNRRCCKRGTRCTVSARRLAAPTPASPLPRLHRRSHACIAATAAATAATAAATAATAATAAATPPSLVPRPPISALLSSPPGSTLISPSSSTRRSPRAATRCGACVDSCACQPPACARAYLRRSAARSGRPRTHAHSSRAWPRHAIRTAYPLARC